MRRFSRNGFIELGAKGSEATGTSNTSARPHPDPTPFEGGGGENNIAELVRRLHGKDKFMSYTGTVKNGVVVLPEEVKLDEGTRVRVEPITKPGRQPRAASPLGKMLLQFAGKAKGLPPDMARNHDHYLHGLPRK
jgi:hypothetical protein